MRGYLAIGIEGVSKAANNPCLKGDAGLKEGE